MKLRNETILFSKEGRRCVLTLNRPEKLNALNVPLVTELNDALDFIKSDKEISLVIITGAGRAFSAGVDLDVIENLGSPDRFRTETRERWHKTFNTIEGMEKLFIAALNGLTLGGALELALACDLRVAAADAVFGLPQINFGLIPDAGGTIRLTNLIGPGAAKELLLSGKLIPSEDAKSMGLIQQIFSTEHFMEDVFNYSKQFEQKSPIALGLGKSAVNKNMHQDIGTGLEDALFIQSILLETREHQEALDDFKKKHKLKPNKK